MANVENPYETNLSNNLVVTSYVETFPEPFKLYNAPLRYSGFSRYMDYYKNDLDGYTLADENAPVFIEDNQASIFIELTDIDDNRFYSTYEKGNISEIIDPDNEPIEIAELYKRDYKKIYYSIPSAFIEDPYIIVNWGDYDDMGEPYTATTLPQNFIDYKCYSTRYFGEPPEGYLHGYTILLLNLDSNKHIDLVEPIRGESRLTAVGAFQILNGDAADFYTITRYETGLFLEIDKGGLRGVSAILYNLPYDESTIYNTNIKCAYARVYIKDPVNKRHAYYQDLDATLESFTGTKIRVAVNYPNYSTDESSFSTFDLNNCEIYVELGILAEIPTA